MLDVRRLEVLAAAVQHRSLAAAARSLGITPSAASQAIAALEAQAGTTLLQRRARGVVPTPAGERLALQAEAVLAQLARAEAELSADRPGSLRIAAFPTAVFGLVADAIAAARVARPAMSMTVLECEPDDARSALNAGQADVALVNHDASLSPDEGGRWRVQHVLDEPVFAVLPADHAQASRQRVNLSRLSAQPWVMQVPASPCQQLTMRACAAAGFAPDVAATCADYRSIIALVAAGVGVSLVPELAIRNLALDGVVLRPAAPAIRRRVNALVRSDDRSIDVVAFLEILRRSASR
jgi:DNA-binding transcriptional LysR family regulator